MNVFALQQCVDNNGATLPANVVSGRSSCLEKNYQWVNSPMNFDNVFRAYFNLLEVASFKGWILLINNAVDTVVSHFGK